MAHTKNTERKHTKGLPKARFSRVATRAKERDTFYQLTLQLPPQGASDWTSLNPSGVTSPELERTVERLNAKHLDTTLLELVEDLHKHPPTSSDETGSVAPDLSKQLSKQPEDMIAEKYPLLQSHLLKPSAQKLWQKLSIPQCC